MVRPESLYVSPEVEIVASRNLIVYAWRDAPTVAIMREVARAARAVAKQHPAGSGGLNLFVRGTPRFSDDVRSEHAKIYGDPALFSLGMARVFLMPGLAAVAVRVFLNTGALMAARTTRPVQAFTDLDAAAAWLAPKLEAGGERWKASDVAAIAAPYVT